jgi:hypothetical protein
LKGRAEEAKEEEVAEAVLPEGAFEEDVEDSEEPLFFFFLAGEPDAFFNS